MYRFKRLPFELSCSAAVFARKLAEVLTPLRKQNWVRNYLDDIIVYAPSYDELLKRVGQLFTHMSSVGIKLNLTKCKIGQKQVKFLGHIVSKERHRPDPANIEEVIKMKPPTTVKETRRFLGMVGFYRKHTEGFCKKLQPL